MSEIYSYKIRNDFAEIEPLTGIVNDLLRRHYFPQDFIFRADLALEETLSNIIKYGFVDKNRHFISVSITVDEDSIIITIKDKGVAFDPLMSPPPPIDAPLTDKKPGGLGIYLTRHMVDSIKYRRRGTDNILEIMIKLSSTWGREAPVCNSSL